MTGISLQSSCIYVIQKGKKESLSIKNASNDFYKERVLDDVGFKQSTIFVYQSFT